jgi:hypothetical protein
MAPSAFPGSRISRPHPTSIVRASRFSSLRVTKKKICPPHLPRSWKSTTRIWRSSLSTTARRTRPAASLTSSPPRIRGFALSTSRNYLPAGSANHALQKAYEASTADWLLFTDADVRFKPDVLRRAIALAKARNLDHLTLMGDVEMVGFWETVLITFFGMAFHIATDPYRVANPNSRAYIGVGAFQLLKRAAYEASGTHRRLAMEVVDDMKLGKIVKQSGFRSGAGIAQDFVVVRWHAGLGNLIRGVTKNFFASVGYSVALVAIAVTGLLLMNVAPIFGIFFGHGWIRIFAAIALVIALCFHTGVDISMRVSPFYAFTHPLGALLFSYMLLRSTVVTLKQGGIIWRDTFYPLEDLKRGVV